MNIRPLSFVVVSASLIGSPGCAAWNTKEFAWPNWCSPGWIDQQRNRAEQKDPYPTVDFGQWMYGTRPLDYQVPKSEARQIQNGDNFSQRYGQPPMQPILTAPPVYSPAPVYTPPPVYAPPPVNTVPPNYLPPPPN